MAAADPADEPSRVAQLLGRQEILDCLHLYARGVDRGDWDLVASTYHPDAHDDHGPYKGDVPGLIAWLRERFDGVEDSTHFLGQVHVDFHDADHAHVETYFVSRRLLLAPDRDGMGPDDRLCREVWGRYEDEFARREGRWAVARRLVVVEARYATPAWGGARVDDGFTVWGRRS